MDAISPFWFITIVTLISGAGGTGLGGVVGALFKSDSNKVVSLLLAFAGGVMTAMVCFELLDEAIEAANELMDHGVLLAIASTAFGVVVVYVLNLIIDRRTQKEVSHTASSDHPETHDDIDELIHADHLNMHKRHQDSRASLVVAGVVMALAIALHNIPEGMTIGASFVISDDLFIGPGMIMAVLIGMHNIPEGMAVSVPLISGGMSRSRAIVITALCGLPTLFGAWLGFWLGGIGALGLCLSLGFAGGAMLYVVFGEIMPEAYLMYQSKLPAFSFMVGLALGMLLIFF